MRFLVIAACLIAAASSQYYFPHAVIGHNGHPIETPEVQQAKQHHFTAHSQALHGRAHHFYPNAYGHVGALPQYTPEVASARQQHFHDYAVAAQRNGVYVPHPHPAAFHVHPVDTPEVQHAKALHFAAHAKARGHHYRRRRSAFGYGNHYEIPVISHQGVPLDTPEVEAVKAKHFAAHTEALHRLGHVRSYQNPSYHNYDHHNGYTNVPYYGQSSNQYTAIAPSISQQYNGFQPQGSYNRLINAHNGAPVETPEVQQAKAAHFAAHAKVRGFY